MYNLTGIPTVLPVMQVTPKDCRSFLFQIGTRFSQITLRTRSAHEREAWIASILYAQSQMGHRPGMMSREHMYPPC